MKVPNFLQKQIDDAVEAVENLRPLAHVINLQPRIEKAKAEKARLTELADKVTSLGDRLYSDEEVIRVLDSNLDARGSMEHVALAIELNMNYGSLIYFIKMREFCNGGKWTNTQDRVMIYMARGDEADLADMRERNRSELEAWETERREKAGVSGKQ